MPTVKACPYCGAEIGLVYNAGNPIWIDLEPAPDGPIVLRGDPLSVPAGHFVAAFFGVPSEGDEFFGIAAGAPRYRRHVCE